MKSFLLRTLVVVAMLGALVCHQVAPAAAEPANSSPAHAEYIRLRNLDPAGDKPLYAQKWIALASQLFSEYNRTNGALTPRTLFFAADTNLRVWRHTKDDAYLSKARRILDTLINANLSVFSREYHDGLILRGDVALAAREEPSRFYERAAGLQSGAVNIGGQRLQSLRNGSFSTLTPSRDIEVPRLLPTRDTRGLPPRKRIVLDPGHGGYDGGAEGMGGLLEKDLVLDIANKVKRELEARYPVVVLLTRSDDSFVPLARRTNYANRRQADIFVSLHMNASPTHKLHGLEAYYLDTTDDEASRLLAERENGIPSGGEVDDLSFILSDLIQSGKLEDSVSLTHQVEEGVYRSSARGHPALKRYGVKKGPFYVLVGAHMPCSLVELFFIDSPIDGPKLASDQFRSIIARGIASGIASFAFPSRQALRDTPVPQKTQTKGKQARQKR